MKLVLYDGKCGFCNASVTFIWKRDPEGIFSFASIQSEIGMAHLKRLGVENPSLDTFYLIDEDKLYERSEAAVRIGQKLPKWKTIAQLIGRLPRVLRDLAYNSIARNRHRMSSKLVCELPPSDIRERFIDKGVT